VNNMCTGTRLARDFPPCVVADDQYLEAYEQFPESIEPGVGLLDRPAPWWVAPGRGRIPPLANSKNLAAESGRVTAA
jgi:hypothetical protein